ncbi:hypothetical protein [Ellagibacter isourolithinifaciens]|uniref:hypothetical protein n=1 Tax=Ellagibacter isourolithinifaciens TaxID=2137581 RepID=UPI003A952B90
MGATKKELADTLGVAKQTVVNYIERLGLAPKHVTRVGKYDVLDDFAVSAIADAIGKGIPKTEAPGNVEETANDAVVAALNDRISDLKSQNERLTTELAEAHAAREREVSELRSQLDGANARAAKLADRVAGIAEAQQAIAATPWWRRGKLAMKLLGAGSE